MCGIAGLVDLRAQTPLAELERQARAMTAALRHRGPDSQGCHLDERSGLALAHTRLAVVDLTPTGHQPMLGPGGEVLIYNGELYNHGDLRSRLAGPFRGSSDTETLLTALREWGPAATLERLVGMFAWAFWQPSHRRLWLARDRAGEKPLYYYLQAGFFGFASELKALTGLPGFSGQVDRQSLTLYLGYGYVPSPRSIYQGVCKLAPGHCLCLQVESGTLQVQPYWSAPPHQAQSGSDQEWVERTRDRLLTAVRSQMEADVPLGAFLSGGIDSSLVVALMQAQSSQRVRTFTIGCSQWGFSEADQARAVARHLGTEHHELDVTPQQALAVIPRLPLLYDEPFADSSQIPTFLVSQMARQQVTVCLTGDGADELFGGYNRYLWAGRLQRRLARLPLGLRRLGARLIRVLSPGSWDRLWSALPLLPRLTEPGTKLYKLAQLMGAGTPAQAYQGLVACWPDPAALVVGGESLQVAPCSTDLETWMMERDFVTYLPDDILVKLDRAAMGVSLESRAPYLDHRVVELSRSLPLDLKIRQGQSKWVLRQILEGYLPRSLFERPKMGFGVPLGAWLRGPLRDWAQSLLRRDQGFLRQPPIDREWRAFLQGSVAAEHRLWSILMFQSWLDSR